MLAQSLAPLAAASAHGGGNPLLQITIGPVIWTLIIFLVMLFVLWRWGWGALIGKLDARDVAIRGAIDEAREERDQAAKLLAEHQALLDQTRRESSEMIAEAQQEAKREKQRIVDGAREEYDKILARGREQIAQETRAALSELRRTVADLSLEVASKMIRRTLSGEDQRKMAERFVSELERERGGGDLPSA